MSAFRAVAWDLDGTLIDSEGLHQRALIETSAAFGADLSDLPDEAFRGVHMRDVWATLQAALSERGREADLARRDRALLRCARALARADSRRARGGSRARGARRRAGLRVEFGPCGRRRQSGRARNPADDCVFHQPRRRVRGQARSRTLSRSRAPLRAAARRRSSPSRTAARAPVRRERRGSMWSATHPREGPSSAPTERSRS